MESVILGRQWERRAAQAHFEPSLAVEVGNSAIEYDGDHPAFAKPFHNWANMTRKFSVHPAMASSGF